MSQPNGLAVRDPAASLEKVLIQGNLAGLSAAERVTYYRSLCESLGLNELTKPFEYLTFQGKEILYAKRDATDQLRKLHSVSIVIVSRDRADDILAVTARATLPNGRTDESIGAVSIGGLKGDALANAFMKAETKAKRRVTLSIVGLGFLDESEVETIPGAVRVTVEQAHGDNTEPAPLTANATKILAAIDRAVPIGGHPPAPEPVKQQASAPAKKPLTDAELAAKVARLIDTAEVLGIPVPDLPPNATRQQLIDVGTELHEAIKVKEAEMDEHADGPAAE